MNEAGAKIEPKLESTLSDLTPQIAKRAYELYEKPGRQDGRAEVDWNKAKGEIRKNKPPQNPKGN